MITRTVTMKNGAGLYAGPASLFIRKANSYNSSIWIEKDDCRVSAKSLLGVLSLGISMGTKITIIADGEDEEDAAAGLAELIDSGANG